MNSKMKVNQLIAIIADIAEMDKKDIHVSDRLREDIQLDSIGIVHLQVEVEDTFGIRFDPSVMDIESIFTSVMSLAEFIENN